MTQSTELTLKKAIEILDDLVYRYCDLNDSEYPNKWNDAIELVRREFNNARR